MRWPSSRSRVETADLIGIGRVEPNPAVGAIVVDEATGEATGMPERVTAGTVALTQISPVRAGRVALVASSTPGSILRVGFDPAEERIVGSFETLHRSANELWQMGLSFDGEWLTYGTKSPRERLYMLSIDGKVRRKLIDDEFRNRGLVLAPDGDWAAFYSNRDGRYDIWAVRTDGTGLQNLTRSPSSDYNDPYWSEDGRLFATVYGPRARTLELLIGPEGLGAVDSTVATQPVDSRAGPFGMQSVAPDGRHGVGIVPPAYTLGLYEAESGSVTPLTRNGRPVVAANEPAWIDADRFLFWDVLTGEAVVFDLRVQEYRPLRDVPGPSHYRLSPDGSTLYVDLAEQSSDVWLLRFGAAD